MRNHGVAAPERILGGTQGMIGLCRLGEPDVATVTGEVAGLERGGDVCLLNDGSASSVDEI